MSEGCFKECKDLQNRWESLLEKSQVSIREEMRMTLAAHKMEINEVIAEWGKETNAVLDKLNVTLTQIVTVALNKPSGFTGTDVIKLLAGLGIFIVALIFGLEQLGVIIPKPKIG